MLAETPRQQSFDGLEVVLDIPVGRVLKYIDQVRKWVYAVFLGGFDDAVKRGAGFCAARGIAKQPILVNTSPPLNTPRRAG